ncbi:CBS domain-containing protein [Solirubrobacter sp. CPCC 204708]|uniref:CBS domain-containing protein n=1 Tax=Solirubrobacter deserti TaxID=2282478 RepID=A0ABT4RIH4_9ACTN|nr:CBS domain-containing protein [Solirubrobacter deserti]MBE2320262.1 CBS domain-containing protein [Solirubrobacter deserti]MDA0138353.1 CBS domain-containing protein [Solirubrobacter deserti]
MALTVRDIMETNVPSVYPDDPIEQVVHTLRDHELPGVPVVNEGGRCVGIITESDLVMVGETEDLHLPHYIELFGGIVFLESTKKFEERLRKAIGAKAADVMTEDPITIEPDATVAEAGRVIARHKHNRLPVVEHGRLIGVVTRIDVLDALTAE